MSEPLQKLLVNYDSKSLLLFSEEDSNGLNVSSDTTYYSRLLEPHNGDDTISDSTKTVSLTQETSDNLNTFDIYVIESVKSGKIKTERLYNTVLKNVFSFVGIQNYTYLETSSPDSIGDFAEHIKKKSLPTSKLLLLFLSGDTVMFEFLNSFYYLYPSTDSTPQTYILPFPHGTGNALANSLHFYSDLDSIKALLQFKPVHLPVYQMKTHDTLTSINKLLLNLIQNPSILFLVVASWGLHSNLVYESDKPEMRIKYGAERFKIAANHVLAENPVFTGSIQDNNCYYIFNSQKGKWESTKDSSLQDLSYFLLSAVSNLEKTFEISPNSKIDQDLLHLVAIPHVDSDKVMKLMYEAYNHGAHVNDDLVLYKPTKSISLNMQSPNSGKSEIICLDGSLWEVSGTTRNLNFSILQQTFLHVLT